jgi:hypothetical protein
MTFAATQPAKAEDGGMRRSLAGLKNVCVVVERFKPAQEQAGFDGTTFQTDVEQLRSAGITVLPLKQAAAMLYINVNSLHRRPGDTAPFSILLQLQQPVMLRRDTSITTVATTWDTGVIGVGDLERVRTVLRDVTDQFINAWLSVHPKKDA